MSLLSGTSPLSHFPTMTTFVKKYSLPYFLLVRSCLFTFPFLPFLLVVLTAFLVLIELERNTIKLSYKKKSVKTTKQMAVEQQHPTGSTPGDMRACKNVSTALMQSFSKMRSPRRHEGS
jgi:hypothetical protein